MSFLGKLFGDPNKRYLSTLQPLVDQINGLESHFVSLSDEALKVKVVEFKERMQVEVALDDILPEAFAAVREAARRVLKQRHYDVQLLGGIVLHRGNIAEMRTGEGKTLVATLPAYLNAITGKGVHIITVNDYLARRDAVWMGQVFSALGMSTGCITHDRAFVFDSAYLGAETAENMDSGEKAAASFKVEDQYLRPVHRREAYAADIIYGTNNEYGFDYLRDNMVTDELQMVQRGHHFAIVDEVDSILIDEARTPLIISAPAEESESLYYQFAGIAQKLKENDDYNIDEKMKAATLTEQGIARIEKAIGVENLYDAGGISLVHHAEQALRAHALYKRDRDYVVKEGQVIIVDEFTGRLMPGRRWSEGLHQAVEAREGVKIERESQTLATVTFQNYFRMYEKLAGMTGTAMTEAEEFHKIYNLDAVSVPTNKPLVRKDFPDRIYKTEPAKFQAVVAEIKALHATGQPMLVGTVSIEKNEILSQLLTREGIRHELLNAKNHEREGEIIAQAGKLGAVTVATNMAGRGVDILLGGNPADPAEAEKVRSLGGLHIIGTERHEARRIDNQLRGRAGRQGDPGSSQFYLSLEDDLMRIFAGDRIKGLMERFQIPDDMPIENSIVSRSIEAAQNKVEQYHFDLRKHLLEYDDVLNKHRDTIYKRRRAILKAVTLKDETLAMVERELERVVLFHTAGEDETAWNIQEICETARTIFPSADANCVDLTEIQKRETGNRLQDAHARTSILEYLRDTAMGYYENMEREINMGTKDPDAMKKIEKAISLRSIDGLWIEHLDAIEHLRRGIGLRGYGQRDPLVEYKKEAYRLFTELLALIEKQVVYSIFKVGSAIRPAPSLLDRRGISISAPAKIMRDGKDGILAPSDEPSQAREPVTEYKEYSNVGRNDPCPCGSGKKYKRCHGQ
ncbi:MAG: preprotein translocase subunit SecA [Patescibacteria group bacterium]